jgi:group I intron endonuclease
VRGKKQAGNSYIGSSVNLTKRFYAYYSSKCINNSKRPIDKALKKYGYSSFSLEIEFSSPDDVLEREQYYLKNLNPEYNSCPTAGSTLGRKFSEETLAKFRKRRHSEETLARLREHLTKHNSSLEQRAKASERMTNLNAKKGIKVEVTDLEMKTITIYDSICSAAKALKCNKNVILRREKIQMKPFRGKYQITVQRN